MTDEQQTSDETADDRLLSALTALGRRGDDGVAALLVRILEGRAPVADGHSSGTSGGPALDHSHTRGRPHEHPQDR